MRLLLSVIFFSLFLFASSAQDTTYQKDWYIIDTLISNTNLTKTAKQKVDALYKKAVREKQEAQIIKALLYKIDLDDRTNDQEPNKPIEVLKKVYRETNNEVSKAVLAAILAKRYNDAFQNNRWQIQNRKAANTIDSADINTWDAIDFHRTILHYYRQSITPIKKLQQSPIEAYQALIVKGNDSTKGKTLYGLLAEEMLNYLTTDTHPFYTDKIADSSIMLPVTAFVKKDFGNIDSNQIYWQAIFLYQQLLSYYTETNNGEALVRIDIDRLEFANRVGAFSNKEKKYINALSSITEQYSNIKSSIRAYYLLAENKIDLAKSYHPYNDTSNRWAYKDAYEILTQAKNKYTSKEYEQKGLARLASRILQKSITVSIEQTNSINKPLRALLDFRNIDTLYYKIIPFSQVKKNIYTHREISWKRIIDLEAIDNRTIILPNIIDYQRHATEIKIDGLPVGQYGLLTSTGKEFNEQVDHLSISFFQVSNLIYFKEGNNLFVRDYQTGKIITNPLLLITEFTFHGDTILNKKTAEIKGDGNGMIQMPNLKYGVNYSFVIAKGKDYLNKLEEDYFFSNYDTRNPVPALDHESKHAHARYFTDRSIYRPSQKVFFKGIATTQDPFTKNNKLIIDSSIFWVYLIDPKNRKIDSLKTKLNGYGSFNGYFDIPTKMLTGYYTIRTDKFNRSSTSISVEEYKRPGFIINIDRSKTIYRSVDTAKLIGTVTAMSGNSLNKVKIKWKVLVTRYRTLNQFTRSNLRNPYDVDKIEFINDGETMTDNMGKFVVAIKPEDFKNQYSPINNLTCTVSIEATDQNGETRSSISTITIIEKNLIAQINLPEILSVEKFPKRISHSITDFNGNIISAKTSIEIYKVEIPKRIIRERYWDRPDQFLYSRKDYYTWFPNDNYDDDANTDKWNAEKIDYETIKAGMYKIVLTATDSLNQTTTNIKYLQVYDSPKNLPITLFGKKETTHTIAIPGDTVSISNFYTNQSVHITRIHKIGHNQKAAYQFITTSEKEKLTWQIQQKDRGGLIVSDAFVWEGRFFQNYTAVSIPFNDKLLNIKYGSYRNINEPGAKEKWTVTITGLGKDAKSAELLTTMYDASLDQLKPHNLYQPVFWNEQNILTSNFSSTINNISFSRNNYLNEGSFDEIEFQRDILLYQNDYFRFSGFRNSSTPLNELVVTGYDSQKRKSISGETNKFNYESADQKIMIRGSSSLPQQYENNLTEPIRIRSDFRETAFFYPTLYADSNGIYSFEFTFPDALTQWKWMSIAHTKDLSIGSQTATVFTQKQLMVQPNMPRFLREGDQIELSARIANQTSEELTGTVTLELFDPETNKSIDGWFQNVFPQQYFTVEAKQSSLVRFPIQIPYSYNKPMSWRIVAKTNNYSDGEENTIPILANRTLVTESIPILLLKDTTQQIKFDKLLNNTSNSLTHQSLTVEYTSNPVWNVVKSLPYLMEYPYECAEQSFNRLYANLMAAWILDRNPNIKKILAIWKQDSTALKTNLEKNQTLKQLLIEETPWVLEAATEAKKQQQLADLFALEKLADQTTVWLQKMQELQLPNGAFPWFKGGWEDRFITNYIVTGIGKLKRIGALNTDMSMRMKPMLIKALKYLDEKEKENYISLKSNSKNLNEFVPSGYTINYLYMRSFFRDIAITDTASYQFYYRQSKKYWTKQNNYHQSLLATVLFRNGEEQFAQERILPALLENTVSDTKLGLYWKNPYANYWYQEPIIQQAAMINCFGELATGSYATKYKKAVDAMRSWLILNKQTNNWKTTIATADACYALLANGSNWLNEKRTIQISVGNQIIRPATKEEGTGYFSEQFIKEKVIEEMGLISISQKTTGSSNPSPSYGAVYWQYFEALEKITPSATPLSITKKLFVEKMEKGMPILKEIEAGASLQTGDKIVVQLIIKADRDMEYLHLKDMRAAAMEPENVLSGYRWQEKLGFYESTRDASTNFFINYLPKGTHVFRYNLTASQIGVFSVGLASIQNMYAPEFTAHSQSFSLRVNEK